MHQVITLTEKKTVRIYLFTYSQNGRKNQATVQKEERKAQGYTRLTQKEFTKVTDAVGDG